eukprot:jgi/Ulvmu1/5560/UM023_0097.1
MSLPSAVVNLVNRSINGNAPPPAQPDTSGQPDAESILPIHANAKSTTEAIKEVGNAALHPHDEPFTKKKVLGKGGFGVVNLCERKDKGKSGRRRNMPRLFALKELTSPKVFYPGSGDIRDYLPLNEPSIQRFLKHTTIVETYWADVRCLDPKTDAPLEITAYDLTVDADDPKGADDSFVDNGGESWTPLDRLRDVERSCSRAAETRRIASGCQEQLQGIKLQMRIAMEHCDLGSLKDHLAQPGQPTRTLADAVTKARCSGSIDMLRCVLLTALDIAEALRFMHRTNVLHGDLKPHNILLVKDLSDEKRFRAKVSDFGLSAHMAAGQTSVEISHGTEAYLPLEVFHDLVVTQASDIYALGLVMWEIYYGIFWFGVWDAEKRRRKTKDPFKMNYYRPSCSDSCPTEFATIVHDCIKSNPIKRPSAVDVCNRLNAALASLFPAPPPPGQPAAPAVVGTPEAAYSNGYGAAQHAPPKRQLSLQGSWASRIFCFKSGSTDDDDGVTVKHR